VSAIRASASRRAAPPGVAGAMIATGPIALPVAPMPANQAVAA
jgi:hypothetical protein